MLDLRFRPYAAWPHKNTPCRRNGPFRVTYRAALDQLETELENLGARSIVIATGHRLQDIRNDGWPRSDARQPGHPGVEIFFQCRHGSLSFACDTYDQWKDNLRAIGLTLENLRAVERYGATKHGEQYRGYAALPAAPPAPMDRDEAAMLLVREALAEWDGDFSALAKRVVRDLGYREQIYRTARKTAHPDGGGTHERFIAVTRAFETLQAA